MNNDIEKINIKIEELHKNNINIDKNIVQNTIDLLENEIGLIGGYEINFDCKSCQKNNFSNDINNIMVELDKCYEIKKNNKKEENIDKYKKIIKSNQLLINKNIQEIIELNKSIAKLELKDSDNEKNIEELNMYDKNMILINKYISIIDKDGMPYTLLNNIISKIQSKMNMVLANLVDFCINIELNNNEVIFYKNSKKGKLDIELGSGFEKFIVGLAFRIAITQLSNVSSCNFLVIDEGFTCADATNINNIDPLFEYLKTHFDFVIIISHLQVLKSKCDNMIEINKVKGNSLIKYV